MDAAQGRTATGERRAPLAAILVAVAFAVALIAPASASAWKWVFNDFFASQGGGAGAAEAVAKKCHGGKLGYYNFRSTATGEGGETEFTVEVKLDLPVFEKWKSFKNVNVSVDHSENFDPNVAAEIAGAYQDFWEEGESKWEPGELTFRHPKLVVYGQEILSKGVHKEDFKPKDKC